VPPGVSLPGKRCGVTEPETTAVPPIRGSCEDGYLLQFVLTDEVEYRAWMAWFRDQRIKGLEDAPTFSTIAAMTD
jgi:hypothetical protein